MKTRRGFVSNSSSSNFVVAMSKSKSTKIKMTVEIDLKDLDPTIIKTKKQLDSYIEEDLEYDEGEKPKWYDYAVDLLEKKYKLFGGCVCNDGDNPIETFLYENGVFGLAPHVIVIQNVDN